MPALIVSAPLVTTNAGFDALQSAWERLERECKTATVFQTFAWNRAWWRHFEGGKRLRLLCLRGEQGELVGLLPLYAAFWHGTPLRVLRFLGTGASDYNDALCVPGRERDAADAFGRALFALEGWHVLDCQQLRVGGFLRDNPLGPGFPAWELTGEACPYLTLPPTWDTLRAGFGKKTRANIGYYDRALHKSFIVRADYVTDPAQLDAQLSRLFALHGKRWHSRWLPGVFTSGRVRQFHRDAARALLEQDALRLWMLRLDGETQAILYCFAWGGRVCYYQGGWEPSLSKWSMGTVLTARALHSAVDEGRTCFDFLRGDEPYKAKWTGTSHVNVRRILARSEGLLSLARRHAQWERTVEQRAKAWARAL